jgi:hypothetical protein
MEIIYVVLILFSLSLIGANIDMIVQLSYNLGDVIKGRLNFNFFIKKLIFGFFIFLVFTLMAVLLTGKVAVIFTTLVLVASPILFLIGLISSLTGQKLNQPILDLDFIIYLIITRKRKNGK